MNFQAVVVASEKRFVKGGGDASPDVNGNMSIQFTTLAGKLPTRALVLSGTVAQAQGIEAGNTYVVQATYRDTNSYGENFNITNLGKLTPIDLAKLPEFVKAFGPAGVITKEVAKQEVHVDGDGLGMEDDI